MKISLSADLPINCNTYLLERDGDIFRKLLSSHLSLTKMHFNTPPSTISASQEKEEEEEAIYHLITSPDLDWIPSSLRGRVDQHKAEFIDIMTYKRSNLLQPPYSLTISTHSPLLGNRLDARFTLTIQALGPKSCRQTLVGTIKVSFPGLGTIIGHAVKDSLTKTYGRLPVIVGEYVKMRNEVIERGREGELVVGVPLLQDTWLDVPWIHQQHNNNNNNNNNNNSSSSSRHGGEERIVTSIDIDTTTTKKKKTKMEDKQQPAIEIDVQTFEDNNGHRSSRENHILLLQPQPIPPVTLVEADLQLVKHHYKRHWQSFKQQIIQYLIRTLCIMALLIWVLLIRLHIITVSSPSKRRRAAITKRSKSKKSLEAAKQAAAALPPESRGVQRDPADVLRVARSQSLDTTWMKYKKEILDSSESCF